MTPRRAVLSFAIVALLSLVAGTHADAGAPPTKVDQAFQKFWAAKTPEETAQAIDDVVASEVTFEEAVKRLKKGRSYSRQRPGVFEMSHQTKDGVVHRYRVAVPVGYNPLRRYPVRIQLHGDVHGAPPEKGARAAKDRGPFASAGAFSVIPYAWGDAPWWSEEQVANLQTILDTLKRTYNLDENRITVSGQSDGGTGTYYLAMCNTTPFASFLPMNAFILVLGNEGLTLNEYVFPNNLRNKPLFVVNGGRDPIYPTSVVDPNIDHMRNNGVRIDYHPQPEAGHDLAWWPKIKPVFDRFVAEHPRDPVPDQLTWQVTDGSKCNRAHWLIVNQLAEPPDDLAVSVSQGRFTVRKGAANPFPLFAYQPPSGRVDAKRTGNTIRATSEGIEGLTVLISPDMVDFGQPVRVFVNDATVFDDVMVPSVRMLLKWAAIDNDRTMLFGAELRVRIEP
jgi:predicted esterase